MKNSNKNHEGLDKHKIPLVVLLLTGELIDMYPSQPLWTLL